jgi:hypothetical protein
VLAVGELEPVQRSRLLAFLFERCCVVQVTTTGIDRAHRMFTVLNATGKPLARNDVLKAALLGNIPAADSAPARAAWQEMEARLGEDFERLFSHVHAMHGRPGSRVISGILEIAAAQGGAAPFIAKGLGPAAIVYDDVRRARHAGATHSATIRTYLRYLDCHAFTDWVPPVMYWLELANRQHDVVANLKDPLLRRGLGRSCSRARGCTLCAQVLGEERVVRRGKDQARPPRGAAARRNCGRQPPVALPAGVVPQHTEQDRQGGQSLETVHYVEGAEACSSLPDPAALGKRALAVNEQHGAEKVVVRAAAIVLLGCRNEVLKQLAGLGRGPSEGALVTRRLDHVAAGE